MSRQPHGTSDAKPRMAFQPIVEASSRKVFAYEALLRGPNGEPADSILNHIPPEQRQAFDRQCRLAAIAQAAEAGIAATHAKLSINFFPDTVDSPAEDARLMCEAAARVGLAPRRLMLEYSEQQALDTVKLADIIKAFRRAHISTVFDDFGSGRAGLGVLARCTPDFIKLDAQLTGGIATSWGRRLVVENMVNLAGDFRIEVIAEGVETIADCDRLRMLGVSYLQGYAIAVPVIGALVTVERPLVNAD